MSKSERYYYDADAIREEAAGYERKGGRAPSTAGGFTSNGVGSSSFHQMAKDGKRNRRSVWSISTTPFAEAHFATFPPALIEPCILSSSRPGDIVLDPFIGSGTTAMVAKSLGRRCIGIDLGQQYLDMARRRVEDVIWNAR